MKVRELFEMKGPGDYWPGDENIPGSPDYDPRPRRHVPHAPSRDQYHVRPEDAEWERRINAAQKTSEQYKTTFNRGTGQSPNGKAHNVVITINGPSGWGLQSKVNKFIEHEKNIYHNFVDVVTREVGDGIWEAKLYLQAAPDSLILRKIAYDESQA